MARSTQRQPSEWRTILEDLKESGLTQKQYAARIGCHPSIFGWWRKRLKELDGEKSVTTTPAFLELRAPEKVDTCPQAEVREQVRIQSQHGTVVTFSALPPAEYISSILREA